MHRAGSRVLTWVAHSDFSFYSFLFFIFSCLVLFRRTYSPCAVERYTDGAAVSNPKHSLVPPPGERACWRKGLLVALPEGKRKRVSGGKILNRGRSERKRLMRRCSMRHACVQPKAEQGALTIKLIPSWVGLRGWFFLTLKVRVIRSSLISHYFTRVISFFFSTY